MIDWNKHPDAKEVAITYLNSKGCILAQDRLKRPTQTKTVADAVEYYGKTFVVGQWTHIRCGKDGKMFFASGETDGDSWQDSYLVCTRAEFEAYVKEQEGEKCTHELWGDKVYIKVSEPDCDGYLVVVTEGDGYNLAKMEDLKPIKPTISKADCELLLKFKKHMVDSDKSRLDDMLDDFIAMHDIN